MLKVDPFGPAATYTETGTLADPGQPLDWLEFTFFNTAHVGGVDDEFFIRSIQIVGSGAAGVPGDYNNNGVVDMADYVLWRKGGPLANEVNTPGVVDASDYTAWRARFGNTSGAGSGFAGASAPEPGALGLFFTAAASICASGWRRIWQWRK
jgi:hypothetical protein